jgi:hypothetical protein
MLKAFEYLNGPQGNVWARGFAGAYRSPAVHVHARNLEELDGLKPSSSEESRGRLALAAVIHQGALRLRSGHA